MFLSTSSFPSIRYRDSFSPLLELNADSDILSLIKNELESFTFSNSPKSLTEHLVRYFKKAPNPDLEKIFCQKIKTWISSLDQYLEASRYNPLELSLFQDVVRPIHMEAKTVILKNKLIAHSVDSKKLTRIIEKLDLYLLRVLQTPIGGKSVQKGCRFPSHPVIAGIFPLVRPVSALGFDQLIQQAQAGEADLIDPALRNKRRAAEVSIIDPQWSDQWEESLIRAASELTKEEELKELGNQLSTIQLIVLMKAFLNHPEEEWKLAFIVGGLKAATLIDLLHALAPSQLCFLNALFKSRMEQCEEWFAAAFRKQAESLQKTCRLMEQKVDAVGKRLQEVEGHSLKESDLQKIHALADHVDLYLFSMKNQLPKLYDGVIEDEEVCRILFEKIPLSCEDLWKRLTGSPSDPDHCLISDIWHRVFELEDVEDDDDAYEILASWSITSVENYWESGLFGEISEEQLESLLTRKKAPELFILGKDNLAHLGIQSIADWKKLEIFNAKMLKNYLSEETRARQLKERSLACLEAEG